MKKIFTILLVLGFLSFVDPVFASLDMSGFVDDNFDSYSAGNLGTQGHWYKGAGDTDAVVSTAYYSSAPNSLKLKESATNPARTYYNWQTTGSSTMEVMPAYTSFKIYIKTLNSASVDSYVGYYGWTASGGNQKFQIYWDEDGFLFLNAGSETQYLQQMSLSTWHTIYVNYDTTLKAVRIKLNGNYWSDFVNINNPSVSEPSALALFNTDVNGEFYFDDFDFDNSPAVNNVNLKAPINYSSLKDFPNFIVQYSTASDVVNPNISIHWGTSTTYYAWEFNEDVTNTNGSTADWQISKTSTSSDGNYYWYANLYDGTDVLATSTGTWVVNIDSVNGSLDWTGGGTIGTTTVGECDDSAWPVLCNTLRFILLPSPWFSEQFEELKNDFQNKPPFGYIGSAMGALTAFTASSSPVLAPWGTPTQAIFDDIKTVLTVILWVTFLAYIIKRFKHLQI